MGSMKSAFSDFQKHSFVNSILVIDEDGLIGKPLSLKLSKEFSVVFVSQKGLSSSEQSNVFSVPFPRKGPVIPDKKYSHIVFIDREGRDIDFLPKIITKVKNINADFIYAQGLSARGKSANEKIFLACPGAKVVIFGDIFDKKLALEKESLKSIIDNFLFQAKKFGKIKVLGEGLRETFPVFLSDVVDGLVDLVFKVHRQNSLFYIFPKYPPTELSLAHMIQKANPEVAIDFIKDNSKLSRIIFPSGGLNLLGDKYPIAQRIRGIDIGKNPPADEKKKKNTSRANTRKAGVISFFVWLLLFLLFTPVIFAMFFSFVGKSVLYYARGEIDRGDFSRARTSVHLSQALFYIGKQASSILFLQAKIVGQERIVGKLSQDLDLGHKISEGLSQVFNSGAFFSKILSGETMDPVGDFMKGVSGLKNSVVSLNRVEAESRSTGPVSLEQGKISSSILQNIETINPLIKLLFATVDIAPAIFGLEGQRAYLILLQDNTELRPSGGTIESYGVLKLNMGKITEFTMHDVSDADSQLRGHVEPPFGVRRYLQQVHWRMRDSGFDVDFVKSALSSSSFLFAETDQRVDGVIALDASFIKSILHAIGPVKVISYGETVDEKNLYFLIQSHAKKIPPDPVRQKEFLTSLSEAIVAKISNAKTPYLLVAQAILDALLQKHLLFALDSDLQNIFSVNGWSSSLWDERIDSPKQVNDFLGINEANLGMNKANYFVSRFISQKIVLNMSGDLSEELIIDYRNESKVWPGGDYKNYLRIILPKNMKLMEISINDIPVRISSAVMSPPIYEAKNFKAPQGLEVEEIQEDGKKVIGFLVNVPLGKTVKVKLKLDLAGNISGSDVFSYNLKLFKQPGVDSIPYSFSLTYPKELDVVGGFGTANGGAGRVTYSGEITGDKNIVIDFAKK